jgi:hypothetical protein
MFETGKGETMDYDEIKRSVLSLGADDQRRIITDVVPEIWTRACLDDSCAARIKDLVDRDVARSYEETHMGGI